MAMLSTSRAATHVPRSVVTDLTICIFPPTVRSSTYELDPRMWRRIEKELYLHTCQQKAWLYVRLANEDGLAADGLVVTDIAVSELPPSPSSGCHWESRSGGIWVLKSKFSGAIDLAVREVDVLFGVDAVDPRPQWVLMESPLQLKAQPEVPIARLSVRRGMTKPRPDRPALRVGADGRFKILLISDTHMRTGVGVCKDAIDADGKSLPESEADPLTVGFIERILDAEKLDLVVLTGDQVHHNIHDTQSALFKVVAPMIKHSIPWVTVFGNHDSEGLNALSRTEQMLILQSLPSSLCETGPEEVDGIGNFYHQVLPLASAPSQVPLSTLYFLDSHGQLPSVTPTGYDHIKQSQIGWFTETSRALRKMRKDDDNDNPFHLAMVFQHIPLPEFGCRDLRIFKGHRREPTEGPTFNSGFYQSLVKERISGLFCGHDHVNDFCALLPQQTQHDGDRPHRRGPWLCYTGCAGFGGYCSYDNERFYRGARVLELDSSSRSLKTWRRVEYAPDRVDELVLVDSGAVVDQP